jgi:putative nucleotide binding protein
VKEREKEFVEFFNKADAINKRLHQLELLPGLGKKYMHEILEQREQKEFKSFEDISKRISNLPHPEKAVEKRIIQELTNMERYNLFTQ